MSTSTGIEPRTSRQSHRVRTATTQLTSKEDRGHASARVHTRERVARSSLPHLRPSLPAHHPRTRTL